MSEITTNAMDVVNAAGDSIEGDAPEATSTPTPAEASALEATESKPAAAAKAAVKAAEKKLKKLKLKVDGEEFEEEFDPEDDDYITKQLQMAKVAQKRMSEYAGLEKDVKQFFDTLKKDPRKVLTDPSIGVDLKQLAAQIIEEEIENAKKSPEQLEKERIEAELKAIKEERQREKEEAQLKEFERLQQQETERYDTLFTKALESSNLPKTPYIVKKMADYMYLGIQEGIDVTPSDVIPLVREEMQNDIKEMFAAMPDEVIEQLIGSEKLNSIRKRRVAAAKNPPPTPVNKAVKDTGKVEKPTKDDGKKKLNYRQFFGV